MEFTAPGHNLSPMSSPAQVITARFQQALETATNALVSAVGATQQAIEDVQERITQGVTSVKEVLRVTEEQ